MLQYNCKAQEDHLHKTIQSLRVDRANQEEAKGSSTKTLRSTFQTSPVSMLKSFNLSKLSSKLQPFYCLGICFSRLKPDRQAALVSSAVFPRVLSEGDAQLPLSH